MAKVERIKMTIEFVIQPVTGNGPNPNNCPLEILDSDGVRVAFVNTHAEGRRYLCKLYPDAEIDVEIEVL